LKEKLESRFLAGMMILGIILTSLFTYLSIGFVRQEIAPTVARFLWVIDLLLKSTPQWIFWGLLVFSFLFAAGKSLSNPQKTAGIIAFESALPPLKRDRVSFWLIYVSAAIRGDARNSYGVADLLGGLVLEVLAQGLDTSTIEIRRRLLKDELDDLPSGVKSFLLDCFRIEPQSDSGFWESLKNVGLRIMRLILRKETFSTKNRQQKAMEAQLNSVIKYLEEQMEVKNDR
jgi:hypothetical protein